MISLTQFEPFGFSRRAPVPEEMESGLSSAAIEEAYQKLHQLKQDIASNFEKTKAFLWKRAIMLENGGVMPPDDEIRKRATNVVTTEGTHYLLWDHPPIKPGDTVNKAYAIASLKKPNL